MEKRKFTPDDVWAMLAENAVGMQELRESQKETGMQIKELHKETNGISKNIGYHAEQFFQDALEKSKTFGGIKYDRMEPNLQHKHTGKPEIEFDIALINGSSIAIIEVKSRVRKEDFVLQFAGERMKKFRELFPEFKKHKAYLGIAAFSFSKEVLEKAKKCGIGIIKAVGNSAEMEAGKLKVY